MSTDGEWRKLPKVSTIEVEPALDDSEPLSDGPRLGDGPLLVAALEGEDLAWAALIERYTGLVSSIAWSFRMGSADVAEIRQVVWLRLFENLDSIREPQRLAGWIQTVTRNECQHALEKYRREVPTLDAAATAIDRDSDRCSDRYSDWNFDRGADEAVDGRILALESQAAVRRALLSLSGKGRMLIEALLDHPSLSYQELAAKLDMPVGSIGPTRQRCFRKLRFAPELADLAAAG